jgi:hypothetical protein
MKYPEEITPQPDFIKPFPLNELTKDDSDYHVCFRIDGALEDYTEPGMFNGRRKLMRKCFLHMPHLSMNLHGGLFKPEHVKFVQKRPGSDNWDGNSAIDINEFIKLNCIEEKPEAVPVFYESKIICQKGIKTRVTFSNKGSYKAMRDLFANVKFPDYHEGIEVELSTNIKIVHVPTNLNYWHLQMEVYPESSDKVLNKDEPEWRQLIFENIRDNILRFYFQEKPTLEYIIPEKLYKK